MQEENISRSEQVRITSLSQLFNAARMREMGTNVLRTNYTPFI
jgi:hypothetical protein